MANLFLLAHLQEVRDDMSTTDERPLFYWQRYVAGGARFASSAGADLAALRRGVGRLPGSVPAMWPFYTQINSDGRTTARYAAEHAALTLFAIHQQSQATSMHRPGIGLGTAVLRLRQHGQRRGGGPAPATGPAAPDWSKESPVDRRFNSAATASDVTELVLHLRGLVTQLRGIAQPLDYTMLFDDLRRWDFPEGAARARRRWGMQYFTRNGQTNDKDEDTATDPTQPTDEESL
ncbi:type I-E CRISPR-associated protein Cse2/CasB [Dactylosporangium sp. NPDC048998]|uniref:type I-E CRISPR-associated protein Cse2/CasB n=1 Tax=Dactylosporangium sp. NPDC048998 TaxID=3363976 RepID=UPI00371D11FE